MPEELSCIKVPVSMKLRVTLGTRNLGVQLPNNRIKYEARNSNFETSSSIHQKRAQLCLNGIDQDFMTNR